MRTALTAITLTAMAFAAWSCARPTRDTAVAHATISPPALDATAPAHYGGVHNVVAYADGLYSGSVPEGEQGFATLKAMGVKTIISVDGATPDLDTAKKYGLRYVHLPIGYNGMDETRTLQLAKAVRDMPGPVYMHCHHGKHRSAGAAGAAAVTLGLTTNDAATQRMKVSGTSPNYPGLYKCVTVASPADDSKITASIDALPQVWQTTGMVKSMVAIEHTHDHLKKIEAAGWKTPADHPDLVPIAEAGQLADLFRILTDDNRAKAKGEPFTQWLLNDSKLAEQLEQGLDKGAPAEQLSAIFKQLTGSCADCHKQHRD